MASNKYFLIFVLLFIHTAFWFIKKPAPPASDALVYTWNAKMLASGQFHFTDSPKNHRLIVIAPVALLISLFGDSPYMISLWPLLCSLATITSLFLFLSKHGSQTLAFIAAFFIACNPLQIDYSAALFPDVIVAMFAWFFLVQVFKRSKAFLATVIFLFGFFAKETIVLVLPLIFFLFIGDLKHGRPLSFWKTFFIQMIIATVFVLFASYLITGDYNAIYHSIESHHNEVFAIFSTSELARRLTYQPLVFLFTCVGFSILFVFAIVAMITPGKKIMQEPFLTTAEQFPPLGVWVVILLATYWWMPTSFSHWSPVLLDHYERMWILLLLPLSILSAIVIEKAIEEKGTGRLRMMMWLFAAAAAISIVFISKNRAMLFLMFALSAALVAVLKRLDSDALIFPKQKRILAAIILAPVFITGLYFTIQN